MYDPNKSNVAVCLVGRITKYEVNIHSLKKFNNILCEKYNVYYFCSLNTKRDKYHINFEKFIRSLGVKTFLNYEFHNLETLGTMSSYIHMKKMCSMFYNQKRCLDMIIQSAISFDIVFKWRTEIYFDDNIKLKINDIANIRENTIYIPNCNDWGGLNDQIAYGNLNTMKLYSDLYNHLTTYNTVRCHPETLLKYHVTTNKINIERFDFGYYLKRD
jgi:hypothetical protein